MRQSLVWEDVYSPAYDINRLQPGQLANFKRHQITSFPVFAIVLLHFVTGGIFDIVYYGLMHSKLPYIRHDDPTGSKTIGFWFIPFYNLYWAFFVFLRLVDRVNFQFRLRNQPPPVSRGLFMVTQALSVLLLICGAITVVAVPFLIFMNIARLLDPFSMLWMLIQYLIFGMTPEIFPIGLAMALLLPFTALFFISFVILDPIALGLLQSACNKLASEQVYVAGSQQYRPAVRVSEPPIVAPNTVARPAAPAARGHVREVASDGGTRTPHVRLLDDT